MIDDDRHFGNLRERLGHVAQFRATVAQLEWQSLGGHRA